MSQPEKPYTTAEFAMPRNRKPRPPVLAVSLRDAAGVLGLSHRTIQGMVHRGELPSFKVGNRRLLSIAELRRWVDAQSVGQSA